jgi:thiol-disulfide isomerase/thioredoxin
VLLTRLVVFTTLTLAVMVSLAGYNRQAPASSSAPGNLTLAVEKNPGLLPVAVTNAWDLPPLLLNDLDGEQRSLYDWRGRVIVLNFWASWCGPCQSEIPHLVRYQRDYQGAGLQVIGVALDEARKARNVVRTLHINYPVLVADPQSDQSLLRLWGDAQQVLPYTVVIGRDGHIHFTQVGIMDEETFDDYVLPLLGPLPPVSSQHDTGYGGLFPASSIIDVLSAGASAGVSCTGSAHFTGCFPARRLR